MSNLYQDAILDAKALRASAMANAKAALEEAFEPKIQEMMRIKLSEEFDTLEEDDMAATDLATDAANDGMEDESVSPVGMEENMDINEAELEEILAQLEELSATDVTKHETGYKNLAQHNPMEEDMEEEGLYESMNEEAEEEEGEEEEEDGMGAEEADETEEIGDDTKVIDITLGDLKKVLQSVNADKADMSMDIPSDEADADAEAESEISLDEILAELEAEETEGAEEVHDVDFPGGGYAHGHQHPTMDEKKKSAVAATEKESDYKKIAKNQPLEEENELEEAKATIETLRENLQEVNLLNAKYLYMNKLFKSKSLTESQKVKVINALDRASNVAEVKNTYETLKESFTETKKAQLKESIGFASQAAGMAPKGNIVDADPFINRWQKLAGIPKRK